MTALDAAAPVEGYRGNQPGLGDDPSTRLVQPALTAKGFQMVADGRYGWTTTAAYLANQRSIGYRGIDANGLPGPTSLTWLGQGFLCVCQAADDVVVELVLAGSGSDLSEELVVGVEPAALDVRAVPECPPGSAARARSWRIICRHAWSARRRFGQGAEPRCGSCRR